MRGAEPKNETELEVDNTLQVMRVIEALEDLDDVQDVYTTLTISDAAMAQLEAALGKGAVRGR